MALARARHALAKAHLDPEVDLKRLNSVTNEVWLAGDHVVRVNRHPVQRLWREATLTSMLPPEVKAPRVVAYGGIIGADWMVTERATGQILARCWPTMADAQRRSAVTQLAAILRSLHRFECPEPLPAIEAPQILSCEEGAQSVERIIDALSKAQDLPFVDPVTMMAAKTLVREVAPSLGAFDTPTFIHGDLHFENVLWDGEEVTALLDFEFSRAAPPDLDLDVFLRFCAYPFLHVAPDYEHLTHASDYEAVPWWLAQDYPALFETPGMLERLRVYSIAYDVRDLLEDPPSVPVDRLSHLHPYHRLQAAVRGECHLDRFAHARVEVA